MFTKLFAFIKGASFTTKVIMMTAAVGVAGVAGGGITAIIINNQGSDSSLESSENVAQSSEKEAQEADTPKGQDAQKEQNTPKEQDAPTNLETPSGQQNAPREAENPSRSEQAIESEKSSEPEPKQEPASEPMPEPTPEPEPAPAPEPEPIPEPEPAPELTCSDLKNCDYNLNDKYVIETDKFNFYDLPEGVQDICRQDQSGAYYVDILSPVESKTFYQIGNFTGQGGRSRPNITPNRTDRTFDQADRYGAAKNLYAYHDGWGCGGMGDIRRDWTWQETVEKGFALDEAKCATWGLSCGRW